MGCMLLLVRLALHPVDVGLEVGQGHESRHFEPTPLARRTPARRCHWVYRVLAEPRSLAISTQPAHFPFAHYPSDVVYHHGHLGHTSGPNVILPTAFTGVGREGFEPSTYGLKVRSSTD